MATFDDEPLRNAMQDIANLLDRIYQVSSEELDTSVLRQRKYGITLIIYTLLIYSIQ